MLNLSDFCRRRGRRGRRRMRRGKKTIIRTKPIYLIQTAVILYTILITKLPPNEHFNEVDCLLNAIAPTIDYSHNMRILKLPRSTPVGSLIYRLKGSDGDPNTQLVFGVSGIEGRALLDIVSVPRSWNEADVFLRAPLEESIYNLTIYVTDGNKTTQVESTVYATPDEGTLIGNQSDLSLFSSADDLLSQAIASTPSSPFVNPKHVFHVPENTKPNESIGSITVLESQKSGLPVRFELRGKGSEKFSIKYVFGPKGQSRAELVLAQQLDYEKQNLFNLKVLALNAWTNVRYDTRNVATMDIVITVSDVQDTPPVFKNLPHSLKLSNNLQVGDLVAKLEAEDGDYADQRPINYALDATSPLSGYFDIDKLTGEVRLIKSMSELALHATWDLASWSMLTVFASEQPDTSSYDHLWPPMYAKVELPLVLVDMVNEAPKFIGGWQTSDTRFNTKILHAYMKETSGKESAEGNIVRWYTNSSETGDSLVDNLSKSLNGRPSILDLGLGPNGTFELTLEGGDSELFKIDPSFPITRQTTFTLTVANSELLNETVFDHDTLQTGNRRSYFSLDIVARDFGSPQRQSSRVKCSIELVEVNDNLPEFESDFYSFSVYENAQIGTLVGSVRARDLDSAEGGQVRYTSLAGLDNNLFRLNQDNGQITLSAGLDRERKNMFLFLVEARDLAGLGKPNYTQVMINVLDVNDNAPVFLQSHYDAVLLPDGTFYQPLVVRAVDADEPNSANSQVAYEIIAGNQNDLFSIDTVSGVIYSNVAGPDMANGATSSTGHPVQIPPTLKEPIGPFKPLSNGELSGKILPTGHEVEETTYSSLKKLQHNSRVTLSQSSTSDTLTTTPISIQYSENNRIGWPSSSPAFVDNSLRPTKQKSGRLSEVPSMDVEQLPALDLLLNLETSPSDLQASYLANPSQELSSARALSAPLTSQALGHAAKVPPVSTLVVRAHDFGIPLRSSNVKVNIYNQALLSRSVSVILNGTAEQIEQRKEAIERAFSSITGSKATIESVDALSESSSLSVARVKLAVPLHSLVDLTDLSALMNALDYHQHEFQHAPRFPTHYIGVGANGQPGILSYVPVETGQAGTNATSGKNIFTDIHSYAMDTSNALERRLLIYIIIVGVCILSLLVIWMVYSCSRENDQVKVIEKQHSAQMNGNYRPRTVDHGENTDNNSDKTFAKTAQQAPSSNNSAIGNNLAKTQKQYKTASQGSEVDPLKSGRFRDEHLLAPMNAATATSGSALIKPDHYSMYNGQVWFESVNPSQRFRMNSARSRALSERRASSAPSAGGNSLDSTLHSAIKMHSAGVWPELATGTTLPFAPFTPRNASGQFFPNTLGYMENLAALELNPAFASGAPTLLHNAAQSRLVGRRQRGRKVAPMVGALSGTGQRMNSRGAAGMVAKPLVAAGTRQQQLATGYTNEAFAADEDLNAGNETNSDLEGQELAKSRPQQEQQQTQQQQTGKHHSRGHHHHHSHHHHNRSHHRDRRHRHEHRRQSTATDERSFSSPSSSGTESQILLDSDQELLGFDSTGTPIIATHTRTTSKSLVIDMLDPATAALHEPNAPMIGPAAVTTQRLVRQRKDSSPSRQTGTSVAVNTNKQAGKLIGEQNERTNKEEPQKATMLSDSEIVSRAPAGGKHEQSRTPAGGATTHQSTHKSENQSKGAQKAENSTEASSKNELSKDRASVEAGEQESGTSSRVGSGLSSGKVKKTKSQGDLMSELNKQLSKRQQSADSAETGKDTKQAQTKPSLAQQRDQKELKWAQASTASESGSSAATSNNLRDMKNSELLEKQSIFALTYSGLTTDKLPE